MSMVVGLRGQKAYGLCKAPILLLLLNACVRVADVMIFTFISLMPVHHTINTGESREVKIKINFA